MTINDEKMVCTIHEDGRVELGAGLTFKDMKGFDLPYLYLLREIVRTAIYDKEREPHAS